MVTKFQKCIPKITDIFWKLTRSNIGDGLFSKKILGPFLAIYKFYLIFRTFNNN